MGGSVVADIFDQLQSGDIFDRIASKSVPPPVPKPTIPIELGGDTNRNMHGVDYDSPSTPDNQAKATYKGFKQDHPYLGRVLDSFASDPGILPMESAVGESLSPLFESGGAIVAGVRGATRAAADQVRPLLSGVNPLEHPLKILPDLYDAGTSVAKGAREGIRDYRLNLLKGTTGNPVWGGNPEPQPNQLADLSPIPGNLPSGRVPGKPDLSKVNLGDRSPLWSSNPGPQSQIVPDLSPIPGSLPSGRAPGGFPTRNKLMGDPLSPSPTQPSDTPVADLRKVFHEQAYPVPEGSTPASSMPKDQYVAAARTVKANALSRGLRYEGITPEQFGVMSTEDIAKIAKAEGVQPPNSDESRALIRSKLEQWWKDRPLITGKGGPL